ncbi:MAG: hypothetical protein HGB14_05885 [Anaerolineaceae bacterium]|nr:hypothetical protein [Anaerolineaceae bacterium]
MTLKKLAIEFGAVFATTLISAAIVTFLWNFIGYGESSFDWETSFRIAIIFGIVMTWLKAREMKPR